MRKHNYTKTYGVLGQVLCGGAGAIIGFVLGGIGMAILGIIPGILFGLLLQKSVMRVI